jgi:hypothetical protein
MAIRARCWSMHGHASHSCQVMQGGAPAADGCCTTSKLPNGTAEPAPPHASDACASLVHGAALLGPQQVVPGPAALAVQTRELWCTHRMYVSQACAVRHVQCGMCSVACVACAVWHVQCGMCSVACAGMHSRHNVCLADLCMQQHSHCSCYKVHNLIVWMCSQAASRARTCPCDHHALRCWGIEASIMGTCIVAGGRVHKLARSGWPICAQMWGGGQNQRPYDLGRWSVTSAWHVPV